MKGLSSRIYDKNYYLNVNLGSDIFKKYKGKRVHEKTFKFADFLVDVRGLKILDLGCGRGDLVFELARRGAEVTGVDYSKDGIMLAKNALKLQPEKVRKNVRFVVKNAKSLSFKENTFDAVVSYDVFEHLYKSELEIVMRKLSKIIKPGGLLLVHTETNKIYLDLTHHIWSYRIDYGLVKLNKLLFRNNYPGLNKDPRNTLHKKQHVNEPTIRYLKNLFKRHKFSGKIINVFPFKPIYSWKDRVYNSLVYMYPFSKFYPLNILFANEYICIMKNKK
jgi:ubiquinone/menaquinone biosynthesis C-methylase UbiE